MTIAVLMSTYNGGKYLDEQLASLAHQTVADAMTVYIRDDGSKDSTFDIIDRWKDELSIHLQKAENVGPARSFWELMTDRSIQADYYAFCDQDDIWDADKLETAVAQLQGDCHLYCCNCRIVDAQGKLLQPAMKDAAPQMDIPRVFVTGFIQGCAMVFTNALREYILSKNISCIPMHDVMLMLYGPAYGEVFWDNAPRFSYRVHESNVTVKSQKSALKKLQSTWRNWRSSSKNSMSTVAAQMLENELPLSEKDRMFLTRMSSYRSSLQNKLWLIRCEDIQHIPDVTYRSLRSYKVRLLLGLL